MSKYAKVSGGKVIQVQPYTETGFIVCGDDVVPGWDYDDPDFTAPTLSTADKEQNERDWRDGQLNDYDHRVEVSINQSRRGETPTDTLSTLDTWGTELVDMPELTGFPDTHTRPTAP